VLIADGAKPASVYVTHCVPSGGTVDRTTRDKADLVQP
jgi:hypothetical protein